MKVNNTFVSLQGEGVLVGVPMVFVRLAGCNLTPKCAFCDTEYAQNPDAGEELSVWRVVERVGKLVTGHRPWVCITGGEPLLQAEELYELVQLLRSAGFRITVETNGSLAPPRWHALVDSWSADIKCPSSGVHGVSKSAWFNLGHHDQVKFVAGTKEDLDFAETMIHRYKDCGPAIVVSPIAKLLVDGDITEEYWDQSWLREVWEFCVTYHVRWSLQQHKLVWGDRKGV